MIHTHREEDINCDWLNCKEKMNLPIRGKMAN